jgi:hypothetical protein
MKNKVNKNKMKNKLTKKQMKDLGYDKMTKKQLQDLRKDDWENQQKILYWKDLLSKYPTFDNAYDYMNDILSYTDKNGVVRKRPSASEEESQIIRKYYLESICKEYNIGK